MFLEYKQTLFEYKNHYLDEFESIDFKSFEALLKIIGKLPQNYEVLDD